VRANIEQIGGTVDLKSVNGVGTTFTIKIPLTLAIVSALIVEAGGERFAIPQLSVLELVRASTTGEHRIERIKDTPVLRLRNKLLPLLHLKEVLRIGEAEGDSGFVVVTQVGSQIFGAVVDSVFHTEEIVIKPMSSKLRHIAAFSGTTILGDGSVIMIIDPNGIAQALGRAVTTAQGERADASESEQAASDDLTSLLVFRAGSPQPKAVPLSLVARLEEIDCRRIEISDGRHLVQYRDQLMPLLQIEASAGIKREGSQPMLVFSDRDRSMGLAVDQIVDIVEQRLDIEVASERPGVLGYAVVKGSATEIIDIGHYLPLAFDDWLRRRDVPAARRKRTVLLVDDSAFFREMLTPLIRSAGFQVVAVGSAAQALAVAKSGRPFDIVVTDTEMPDMDGFALAAALRENPVTAATPIIALSAMVSVEAIERGRAVGFYDFVAKFDRAGLIAAIKEQGAELAQAA
jgi:two-component system, chemotaxis family, sensor kinase CheA